MSLLVSDILNMKPKCPHLTSSTDDADAIEGAPSGIQIIGKPMKDEELVQIMAIVTEVLKAKS
jgi:Asp-tRNA(Asn)/Glu-tRNA(Gln) amidotransferase A subunit family amidase